MRGKVHRAVVPDIASAGDHHVQAMGCQAVRKIAS